MLAVSIKAALATLILFWSQTVLSQDSSEPYAQIFDEDVHSLAKKSSQDTNSQLPLTVDSGTRANTTLVGPGRRFTYIYTLTSDISKTLNSSRLQSEQEAPIRNMVCSTTALKLLVQHDYLITYRYFDIDGRHVGDVTVRKQDCASPPPYRDAYWDLAQRVHAGDREAFRSVIAKLKVDTGYRERIRLGEIASLFIAIDPSEYVRGQVTANRYCFGAHLYDPDFYEGTAAAIVESLERERRLKTVSESSLNEMRQTCINRLTDGL